VTSSQLAETGPGKGVEQVLEHRSPRLVALAGQGQHGVGPALDGAVDPAGQVDPEEGEGGIGDGIDQAAHERGGAWGQHAVLAAERDDARRRGFAPRGERGDPVTLQPRAVDQSTGARVARIRAQDQLFTYPRGGKDPGARHDPLACLFEVRGQAAADGAEISRAVIAALINISSETLLEVGFQEDGYGASGLSAHTLAQAALDRRAGLIEMTLRFRQPIIGLGASAPVYYPAVAERLGSEAVIPEHADVANAVGAVVGRIRAVATALISSPSAGIYRLHLDEAPRDFRDLAEAAAFAEGVLGERATEEARRNGADDIRLSHKREDKTATVEGSPMFIESRLSATASGRPRFAH